MASSRKGLLIDVSGDGGDDDDDDIVAWVLDDDRESTEEHRWRFRLRSTMKSGVSREAADHVLRLRSTGSCWTWPSSIFGIARSGVKIFRLHAPLALYTGVMVNC